MDQDYTTKTILYVKVRTPETVLFEGEAEAVSSINEKGVFDVLPLHTNFISVVKEYLIVHEKENKTKKIDIQNGVVRVTGNKVNIFLALETIL